MKSLALVGKYGEGKFALVDDEDFEKVKNFRWYITNTGYITRTAYDYKNKFYPKVIYFTRVIINVPQSMIVDHINRNKLDNRKENLRICTKRENSYNRPMNKNNKSGYRGVYWNKLQKKWGATITANKTFHLGFYNTKEEAALVYNEAAIKYHGEFASLNNLLA